MEDLIFDPPQALVMAAATAAVVAPSRAKPAVPEEMNRMLAPRGAQRLPMSDCLSEITSPIAAP